MPLKPPFRGGLELNFFAQQKFESFQDLKSYQQAPFIARNILRFITMGWTKSWRQLLTPIILHSLFIKRDHGLLKEVRLACQQGFTELFKQLKDKQLNTEQSEQAQLYLSNCLSMLPFGDLNPYESLKIPQYIDNHWELVEYQIIPIELTQTTGWHYYFMYDHDRVFAYGLTPLFQRKAESHLIFMGTTYPAGQGFLTQMMSNFKGFETVGKSLYETGRAALHAWASQQGNPIHVCGASLGGSLSLLFAMDKGNYTLSRIDALNPAGLYELLFKTPHDYWEQLAKKPQVIVQKQGNDPVAAFGYWKNDWVIIQVNPSEEKRGPNSFCDHLLNYAGHPDTDFVYIAAEYDNSLRSQYSFLLISLIRSAMYWTVFIPYKYGLRPILYLAVAGMDASYSSASNIAQIHAPEHPRNPSMDLYAKENAVEIELNYQQIQSYYQVMRCLVKGKCFLPEHEKSSHVKDISKKALLEDSLKAENAERMAPFKVTKAKASHIRRALTLIEQLGSSNRDKLKSTLEECYAEYRRGKH